jgi:hypothetical protein
MAPDRSILKRLPGLIDGVFPLPGRFRVGLGRDVAELSRLLTSGREDRGASYLGKPALLSAYLRYFLPWNIYRLSRILPSLPLDLKEHDAVNDFGSGPLTLAASLWICRPELRNIPLEFRCLDRTPSILEAGKKFFSALTAALPPDEKTLRASAPGTCPWVIKTIKGELKRNGALSVEIRGKPAVLSAAANLYNELFWDFSPMETSAMERFVAKHARLLSSLTDSQGSILVVEPGIPRSGEFISLLRVSLMEEGRSPLSPCTHGSTCPLPGGRLETGSKAKWCHFAFETEEAPEELHRLSAAAGLPKERAVLSYILAGPASGEKPRQEKPGEKTKLEKIRIISDPFPVGQQWGRYGCAAPGLILVTGSRKDMEASLPGALLELPLAGGSKDAKSGAFVAEKTVTHQ